MLFNTHLTGDPRSFFYYKGDLYSDGTEITLKDSYINTHMSNGMKLWKHAKYDHQCNRNGRIAYFFCLSGTDYSTLKNMGLTGLEEKQIKKDHAHYFVIEALEMDSAIEEITKPFKLERAKTEAVMKAIVEPKSEFDNPQMVLLWVVYIIVMIGSLIFKQFYLAWIIETIIFAMIRKDMLNS